MLNQKEQWHFRSERGSILGLRFMLLFYKFGGRFLCYLLLYFVVAYFFITDKKGRSQSLHYLNRVYDHPKGKLFFNQQPGWWQSFQHYYQYGCMLVDKIDIWQEVSHHSTFIWHGLEYFDELNEKNQGAVILSAHIGNIDAIRAVALEATPKTIKVLMFTQHTQRFQKILRILNPKAVDNIIPLESINTQTIFELNSYIEQGDIIGMFGDRTSIGSQERTIQVPFLGESAPFPQGPLILAGLLKCPVVLLFCLRTRKNTYEVFIQPFTDKIDLKKKTRDEQLQYWLTQYAASLEELCCRFPYQWFNFYDFWSSHPKKTP